MNNKWKVAFWICSGVLLFTTYFVLDQGISDAYLQVNYSRARSDLHQLSRIISETDLSKKNVQGILLENESISSKDEKSDTIQLNFKKLIFHNDRLEKVLDR
jgi:regulatory protein YycI of two-component signal transduction system YycFG